jgi:Protein of unknown function (DUF4239)
MFLLRIMNQLPLWLAVLVVVGVFEVYSVGLVLLCRKKWGADRLELNNEVAGFKFAVVGVLYAVLLAFVVVAVWEGYRNTETAVRNEAKAVADLTQISYALPEPDGACARASHGGGLGRPDGGLQRARPLPAMSPPGCGHPRQSQRAFG